MEKTLPDNERPWCWICHDEERDGDALLSGVCSCRGGSGHCHLSCVVEYGKRKTLHVIHDDFFDVDLVRQAW